MAALLAAVTRRTAGGLIETVQGEGGVHALSVDYLQNVRALCDRDNLVLMIDEVQTGLGRTGAWFGFQSLGGEVGFRPDAISLAKGLAGGLPMGACVASEKAAALFTPGSHASTFGGNPLVSRVALELIATIEDEELIEHAALMGEYISDSLETMAQKYGFIREVRGCGLMIGCELAPEVDAHAVVKRGFSQGLILNVVQGHVLRFVPPLIIEEAQIAEGLEALDRIFALV